MDAAALKKLTRQEIQALAKREHIKANLKTEKIIEELLKKYPDGVPALNATATDGGADEGAASNEQGKKERIFWRFGKAVNGKLNFRLRSAVAPGFERPEPLRRSTRLATKQASSSTPARSEVADATPSQSVSQVEQPSSQHSDAASAITREARAPSPEPHAFASVAGRVLAPSPGLTDEDLDMAELQYPAGPSSDDAAATAHGSPASVQDWLDNIPHTPSVRVIRRVTIQYLAPPISPASSDAMKREEVDIVLSPHRNADQIIPGDSVSRSGTPPPAYHDDDDDDDVPAVRTPESLRRSMAPEPEELPPTATASSPIPPPSVDEDQPVAGPSSMADRAPRKRSKRQDRPKKIPTRSSPLPVPGPSTAPGRQLPTIPRSRMRGSMRELAALVEDNARIERDLLESVELLAAATERLKKVQGDSSELWHIRYGIEEEIARRMKADRSVIDGSHTLAPDQRRAWEDHRDRELERAEERHAAERTEQREKRKREGEEKDERYKKRRIELARLLSPPDEEMEEEEEVEGGLTAEEEMEQVEGGGEDDGDGDDGSNDDHSDDESNHSESIYGSEVDSYDDDSYDDDDSEDSDVEMSDDSHGEPERQIAGPSPAGSNVPGAPQCRTSRKRSRDDDADDDESQASSSSIHKRIRLGSRST